ncbi:glycine reductase [Clostridium sp. CM028]|uniref:glycine/sarcosine/betaine reductase complex component C subunit alpha n=1 Tax=unclassified Clostridium TaxID=2614128 RepID=UPI001C0B3F54|nr:MULTISPECIES: glycine/sarcosine/betaine reductase complex component C subunit alpha [unclassified Clostridium]MBU3093089.1 glycine reductase [Clostridium sp. CF011]MBW9149781.1 glycine reductase [Clostridium sp. CM028]WAG71135.1 glycine reductase [Clostridium sp. CF011]WLC62727.1 glycine reductase [Clostridium sp. CM028]
MGNIKTKKAIAEAFNEIADGIKSGSFKKRIKIGLTTYGSEHGISEMLKACILASKKYGSFDIVLIGEKVDCEFEVVEVASAEDGHNKMLKLLEEGKIQGCVTQHFNFPIGVSTVGMAVTPAKGRDMIIATTTGATSTNRVEAMIKNAIGGIAVAKATGIKNPKVGILNIDGAREVERNLGELKKSGYNFEFADSLRADGGPMMRGNDVLAGTPDVLICDSLTGNLLIKMLSSYTTGGDYETSGYGYGPGVGENYDKIINIISRASGAPLICEALKYCFECAQNNLMIVAGNEYKAAEKAGIKKLIDGILSKSGKSSEEKVAMPSKEVVTFAIPGIDILELDDACAALWKEGIYCESGMGCTGPVLMINEKNSENSTKILVKCGYK